MLQFVHLVLNDEALLLSQLRTECFVARRARTGTQFTCFTGTKVQILTQLRTECFFARRARAGAYNSANTDSFTGTKVQILTELRLAGGLALALGNRGDGADAC